MKRRFALAIPLFAAMSSVSGCLPASPDAQTTPDTAEQDGSADGEEVAPWVHGDYSYLDDLPRGYGCEEQLPVVLEVNGAPVGPGGLFGHVSLSVEANNPQTITHELRQYVTRLSARLGTTDCCDGNGQRPGCSPICGLLIVVGLWRDQSARFFRGEVVDMGPGAFGTAFAWADNRGWFLKRNAAPGLGVKSVQLVGGEGALAVQYRLSLDPYAECTDPEGQQRVPAVELGATYLAGASFTVRGEWFIRCRPWDIEWGRNIRYYPPEPESPVCREAREAVGLDPAAWPQAMGCWASDVVPNPSFDTNRCTAACRYAGNDVDRPLWEWGEVACFPDLPDRQAVPHGVNGIP